MSATEQSKFAPGTNVETTRDAEVITVGNCPDTTS